MKKVFLRFAFVFMSALLLVSCGEKDNNKGKDDDDNKVVDNSITISGDIKLGEFKEDLIPTLKIIGDVTDEIDEISYDFGDDDIEKASVKNGEFSIKVEAPDTKYHESISEILEEIGSEMLSDNFNLLEKVEVSDKDAAIALVEFGTLKGGEPVGYDITFMNVKTNATGMYVYADRDVSVKGTATESITEEDVTLTFEISFNMNLKKGWNIMLTKPTFNLLALKFTIDITSVTTVPSGMDWLIIEDDSELNSIKSSMRIFRK